MLNRLHFLISKILKKSFVFRIPKKSSVLLYGQPSKILQEIINKRYISKQILDRNEINIFIFILTLLNGKIFFRNYAENFIKFVNPKIVITILDNDIDFYYFKKYHRNKYFIAIQNGYRYKITDPFFNNLIKEKKKKTSLEADYYLTFNRYYGEYIKKFIKCKIVLNGSYRNNSVKISKKIKFKNKLLFISQYYPKLKNIPEDEHSIFYSPEKKILPILEIYCLKNKLDLIIMLKSNKKNLERYNNEISYYNSFLTKKFKILSGSNPYNLVDKFENIFTIDSTLGYEALARKKKVFFFHDRIVKIHNKHLKYSFGWPKFKRKSNFSININKKNINRYLKSNLILSYKKWLKINNKHINDLMVFNYKNKNLSKLIQSCLKKDTGSNFAKKL